MDFSTLKLINTVYPLIIDKYEEMIPDSNETIVIKMNAIVQQLNRVGKLSNDTVNNWNKVMAWVMDEGLNDSVVARLDQLIADGTFDEVLQPAVDQAFTTINERVTDFENDTNVELANRYTKLEVDNKVNPKADLTAVYTKTAMDTSLGLKADKSTTYTKTEVDNKVSPKANSSDVYLKTESDNNYMAKSTDLTVYARKVQQAWQALSLFTGTTNFDANNTTRYYKDDMGRVWFSGLAVPSAFANNTQIATMPAGYRPIRDTNLTCYYKDTGGITRVAHLTIYSADGTMKLFNFTNAISYIYLDSMPSYRAEL